MFSRQVRGRHIDQVNGLIGQRPLRNVLHGIVYRRLQDIIRQLHVMVLFVELADALENLEGIGFAWFIHDDIVEPAGQGRILHDGVAVFVLGRRPDDGDFAPAQGRLDDIGQTLAAVIVATDRTSAENLLNFIKEQNDVARGLDLFDQILNILFEGAPVLGTGFQVRNINGPNLLVLDGFRHIAFDNSLRQAFDDGCFTDPGVTNQDRVILRPPTENLSGLLNFLIPANNRIQQPILGLLGQISAHLFQDAALLDGLGLPIIDGNTAAVTAGHLPSRPELGELIRGQFMAVHHIPGGLALTHLMHHLIEEIIHIVVEEIIVVVKIVCHKTYPL